jgi:regulatory protein
MKKITKIEAQKRNPKRVNVYVNEEFFIGIDAYSAKKHGLEEGKEVNEDMLKRALTEEELEKGKAYAANYLMNKSERGKRDRLKQKEFSEEAVEGVMEFLDRYGYLNDLDLASRIANDAFRLKGDGPIKIKQKLYQKRFAPDVIEGVLSRFTYEEQAEVCRMQFEKKERELKKKAKDDYDFKNRMYRYLQQRGFTSDIINEMF